MSTDNIIINISILIPFPSYLCQAGEHAAHGFIVQSFRAVHDNDIHAQSFAQVLRCLRLSGTSRAFRRAAPMEVEGCGQGHVTPEHGETSTFTPQRKKT